VIADIAHQFKELADNAPVMIRRAGLDGGCDFFNKPWLDFTGRSFEEQRGEGWVDGVHPDDRDRCVRVYADAFQAHSHVSIDYRLRRHDGEYRWVLDNGSPFGRGDTGFAGYFGSCIDITERKTGEDRLRSALRNQEELLREKEALLGEIHHRVRNNLQVMLGLISLTVRRTTDQGCRAVLESFADRIQALAIVQRHLHETADMSRIDLRDYLQRLTGAVSEVYAPHQVRISIGGDPLFMAPHDANSIGLIAAELIGNSFRHAFADRKAGEIRIETAVETDGAARLTIADNGPGLLDEAEGRSDGLGLALVRTYAGQIGAEVAQASDGGARFDLSLPPRDEAASGSQS
jgi:PAS domain S-box-containing protein